MSDLSTVRQWPEWLDLKRLSEYSSTSVPTLRAWIRLPDDPLPAKQVDNKFLVRREAFDLWLERHPAKLLLDVDVMVKKLMGKVT